MRTTVCILLGLIFTIGSAFAQAPDAETIRGTWELESMKVDGKPLVDKKAVDFGIIIASDGITPTDPNRKGQKNPYKLDPTKSPKWITMDQTITLANKDSKGNPVQRVVQQKMVGVYQLEGDRLTICWSTRNTAPKFDVQGRVTDSGTSKFRPDTLDGGPGTVTFVLKRAAK